MIGLAKLRPAKFALWPEARQLDGSGNKELTVRFHIHCQPSMSSPCWKRHSAHGDQLQCAHPGGFSALVRMSHSFHRQCNEYSMHVAEPKQLDQKRIDRTGLFIHAR